MCDCYENAPKCATTQTRVARKPHKCCECHRHRIRVGEKHIVVSGIWDGGPERFRFCQRCWNARVAYEKEISKMDDVCPPCFGNLKSELMERTYWRHRSPRQPLNEAVGGGK